MKPGETGDPKGAKRALQDGADPNGILAMICLQKAAETGDLEMIGHLLDHGADPNMPAGEDTPLHRASCHGRISAIKLLLTRLVRSTRA